MFWGPPYPMLQMPGQNEDPIKTYTKFMRFLARQEENKKKKEKEKEGKKSNEPWDQVVQVATILLISMAITGPVTYVVWHLLNH